MISLGGEAGIFTQIIIPRQHCILRVQHCATYFFSILEGMPWLYKGVRAFLANY